MQVRFVIKQHWLTTKQVCFAFVLVCFATKQCCFGSLQVCWAIEAHCLVSKKVAKTTKQPCLEIFKPAKWKNKLTQTLCKFVPRLKKPVGRFREQANHLRQSSPLFSEPSPRPSQQEHPPLKPSPWQIKLEKCRNTFARYFSCVDLTGSGAGFHSAPFQNSAWPDVVKRAGIPAERIAAT